jgi:hypothetical protein
MNPQISRALKTAVTLWTAQAVEHLKGHAKQIVELRKAMEGETADVRIIFHIRANAITMETFDLGERTFCEIFREELIPDDGGFAMPETDTKQ